MSGRPLTGRELRSFEMSRTDPSGTFWRRSPRPGTASADALNEAPTGPEPAVPELTVEPGVVEPWVVEPESGTVTATVPCTGGTVTVAVGEPASEPTAATAPELFGA